MEKVSTRVCVTGVAGYIGSWLVNKRLQQGHTVHATLRYLGDESTVGLLKGLPGAENRLLLFQDDLYNAEEFETATRGCQFVFLVATLIASYANNTKYNDTIESSVAAVRNILQSCQKSGTVKRVIYTGSVTAASPLKEDDTGFKDLIDESCCTPLHLSFTHCNDYVKVLLDYNHAKENNGMEVVSLACGEVGGKALLSNAPLSIEALASPLMRDPSLYKLLKFLQALLGSIPTVHH